MNDQHNSLEVDSAQLRSLQLYMLQILVDVVNTIEKMGLRYYLSAGTALGAIRHKGFIPWDDDIDIMMTRADRDRFLEGARNYLPDYLDIQHYQLPTNSIDSAHETAVRVINVEIQDRRYSVTRRMWSTNVKQPIWIDIAVLDEVPDNPVEFAIFRARLTLLHTLLKVNRLEYKARTHKSHVQIADLALRLNNKFHFARLIDPIAITKRIDEILTANNGRGNSRVINYAGEYKFKEIIPFDYLGNGKPLEFEGHFFNAPDNCEGYLTQIYGDYMQLPPIEDRVCKHLVAVNGVLVSPNDD